MSNIYCATMAIKGDSVSLGQLSEQIKALHKTCITIHRPAEGELQIESYGTGRDFDELLAITDSFPHLQKSYIAEEGDRSFPVVHDPHGFFPQRILLEIGYDRQEWYATQAEAQRRIIELTQIPYSDWSETNDILNEYEEQIDFDDSKVIRMVEYEVI